MRRNRILSAAMVCGCAQWMVTCPAMATVGPPVWISMPADAPPAERGQVYEGVWEVRVGRAGVIDDFALEGHGWTVTSIDRSLEGQQVEAGVHTIAFTATPRFPNAALKFSLRFDGRPAMRRMRFGPLVFARRGKDQPAVQSAAGHAGGGGEAEAQDGEADPQDGVLLSFSGRIVYTRPGSFLSDGSPVFLGGTDEGVHGILVQVMDDDGLVEDESVDEVIWSGYTDENGFFSVENHLWDDCDPLCDTPDIYLRWECNSNIVNVHDADEYPDATYGWNTIGSFLLSDFEGNEVDFGTWKPADTNLMAPLHIHNSITRTYLFLVNQAGVPLTLPEIDVLWPDPGNNAYYNGTINISPRREWDEGTHAHEYGHHVLEHNAVNVTPDYCQGLNFCDGSTGTCAMGSTTCCSGMNCEDPGHCRWCPETDHDAWNEGFPNWMADIVTRDFPYSYTFSDGSPYQALFGRSQENIGSCCQDGGDYSPLITEGYLGALLRDIEDYTDFDGSSLQDDHNGDGMCDCLGLGYDEIFTIATVDDVTTPAGFIAAFIARYPEHVPGFRSTAFNVNPLYVAGMFPVDTEPPGLPAYVDSPSHPPVIGGTSPCIELELGPVDDDVTGACGFSYVWTTTPAGLEPDMDEVGFYVEGSCCLVTHALNLGDWWISLRAKDCAGHWSNEWETYGPFTVTECNGNGILDVCEIAPNVNGEICNASVYGTAGTLACTPAPSFCSSIYVGGTCGQGQDCNGNVVPDDCDIANGTSADCNEDGIPDECQDMARWIAPGGGSWHMNANWENGSFGGLPGPGQFVCIDVPGADVTVTYDDGITTIASLSCYENLALTDPSSPATDLIIQGTSFIEGDLIVGGRSDNKLTNNNTLTVSGLFNVAPGRFQLRGIGEIIANGGVSISSRLTLFDGKTFYLTNNSAGSSTSLVVLNPSTTFQIDSGSTFIYQGNAAAFQGGNGLLIVEGTFLRSSGDSEANIQTPVGNSGLIHNQTGEFFMYAGGAHSGNILSDPGTLLGFDGDHDMQTLSSLTADDVELRVDSDSLFRGAVDIFGTLKVDGGGGTFASEANVVSYGQDLFVRSGTVHFESPAAPAVDFDSVTIGESGVSGGIVAHFDTGEPVVVNTLNLVKGSIDGADSITINDSFTWGTGGGSFATGGEVNCDGPSTIQANSSARYLNRVFNNRNYATFLGSFAPSGSGVFNNLSTGTVDLQGDSNGLTGGSSTNAGLIVKTAGAGRSTLAGMTNTGLIHAQTGEIYFYFGGENNGDILGDPGTLLTFNNTHHMNLGSSLIADDVTCSSSTSNVRGDVNISGTFTMDGGTWTFTSDANVTSYGQHLTVLGGTVRFESPVPGPSLEFDTVAIGEAGSGGKVAYFDTGQPVNIATLSLTNGSLYGADPITIHDAFTWGPGGSSINPGGLMTCLGDSTIQYTTSSRYLYRNFDNAGYATVLSAINPNYADYTNLPGGVVDLKSDNARFGLSTTSALYNHGTLVKSGGSGTSSISVDFQNTGVIDIQTGALEFSSAYGQTFVQTDGQTILNGGNLNLTSGAIYEIQGGDLIGNGTVTGEIDNSGGSVVPGLSIGTLTCEGNYTHGTGAAIKIEIGGLNAGTQHDQFAVTGTADLNGGELNVVPFGGFLPQVGQQFVVLTAGSVQGTFDTITGPGTYTPTYNPTNVTLTVVDPPCSVFVGPDFDQDCDVDGDDVDAFIACASGPTVPYAPGCEDMDFDLDGDADQIDFALLQRCISGEDIVAEVNCGN